MIKEVISPYTERALEYDKLKNLLKRYTVSQLGAAKVERLTPLSDIDEIRRSQTLCSETKQAIQVAGDIPLGGMKDISSLLRESVKPGSILDAHQLLDVGCVLRVMVDVAQSMSKFRRTDIPTLFTIVENLPTLSALTSSLNRCIGPEGDILDAASSKLRSIRRRLKRTREQIQSKLDALLRASEYQKSIQEQVITFRNGRYVIPVKQDAKTFLPGVLQGQSASGATMFVEPFNVVEMNNDLHRLGDEELQEIRSILSSLTDEVRTYAIDLEAGLGILAELDFLTAKARFSIDVDAVEPRMNTRGFAKFSAARHPLLEISLRQQLKKSGKSPDPFLPECVVPIDVHIGDAFCALVITGPNTGGKTVVLKMVGLLTLMAQSGLHIPAKHGAEVAVFDQIFADIGDEQSIEQNLSTFSSHITKIANTLKHIECSSDWTRQNSLVLLDEVGAGTDPMEGAAFGMAILDWLGERRVRTVVPTHYGALKAYAYAKEGMENASMEFDWQTLSPTYRLLIGVPGSSNAIKVAERLGIPDSILTVAKAHLGDQNVALEDLIVDMQQSQRELEVERQTVQDKIHETDTVHKEYEDLICQFEASRGELVHRAEREAYDILKNSRRLVDEAIAEIRRESASKRSVQSGLSKIENSKDWLKDRKLQREKIQSDSPERSFDVKVGDRVRLKNLKHSGEVLAVVQKTNRPIQVQVGNMQMQVSHRDIESVDAPERDTSVPPSVLDLEHSKIGKVATELKLLGQTVSEALEAVDKYLDDAFLAGLPTVRIVHGRGTGALRKGVQEELRAHPLVKSFQLASRVEGGEGTTVVTLKE